MQTSKTIIVNSKYRTSGTTNCFSFNIPNDGDYTHCCVLGCNIPVSYYLIQEPYNTFTLTENGTPIIITVPVGNYNINSFKIAVVSLLNTASAHGWVYNMSFSNDYTQRALGKYTFTVSVMEEVSFTFSDKGDLHQQFGFVEGSTNTFQFGQLISTSVVDFTPETAMSISSDICADTNLITIFHENVVPYSYITWQCPDIKYYSKKLRGKGKDTIYTFTLLSEDGNKIDLNGVNMSFNLLLYKDNDSWKDAILNYVKFKIH